MRNSIIIIVSALLLAGCGTTKPVVDVVIQRVEIPIEVPCKVDIPDKPSFNFDNLKDEDTLFDKTKSLLADRKLHLAYEEELLAALKACK